MKHGRIEISTADGSCDAWLAHPSGDGPFAAVLVGMDAVGLRPRMQEMADRIAEHGYCVLVPNLFYRVRRPPVADLGLLARGEVQEMFKGIMPLIGGYTSQLARKDAGFFIDYLSRLPFVRPGRLGVVGYCLGGGFAIRAAACYPDRIACAASFHAGRLVTDAPDSPHLLASQIRCELYVAHADKDPSMPDEQIERLASALKQAGVHYHDEVYRGAAHGWTMADLPAFNSAATERHWKALFDLLERNLAD